MSFVNVKVYYYRNGERNPITDIRRLRVPTTIAYEDLINKIKDTQNWIQDGVTFKYVDEENDLVQFSSNEEWQIALDSLNEKADKVLRVRVSAPNPVREHHREPWGGCGGWRRRQTECPFFAQHCGQQDWQKIFDAAKPFVDSLIETLQQNATTENNSQETDNKKESENQPLIRHFGVTCDGCDQENIIGDRYKCADCPDFDYCGNCYNKPVMRESHGAEHKFVKIEKPQPRRRCGPRFGGCQNLDFSQLLNHPLAQQFLQQQGEQCAPQFGGFQNVDFSQLLNHPLAQQFLQQGGQQLDFSQLLNNIQPFIQQFVHNLSGEQPQQEQQPESKPETQASAAPAPQPTEEEIVIDEEPKEVPQPVFAYSAQLEQLASMGFTETERNKDLLARYKGNVTRVVQVLLQ